MNVTRRCDGEQDQKQAHLATPASSGFPLTQFLSSSVCFNGKTLDLSKSHSDLSKVLLCLSITSPHLGLPWLGLRRHGTFIILVSPFVIPGFCFLLLFFSFTLSQGSIVACFSWLHVLLGGTEELSSEGFDQKAARKGKKKTRQNSFCAGPGVHLWAPKQLAEVF